MRYLVAVLLLTGCAVAAEFQRAKIVDVVPYTVDSTPIIAPNNGHPVLIGGSTNCFTLTVAIGDMNYSGNYRSRRSFKSSEVIVGDMIEVRIEKDKLIVKRPDGKEVKAKIVRRARVLPANDPLGIR